VAPAALSRSHAEPGEGIAPVILILSIIFAILPLLGIVYAVASGSGFTVDTLFLALILLTISGIFGLNILLELRKRGFLKKKAEPAAPTKAVASAAPKS